MADRLECEICYTTLTKRELENISDEPVCNECLSAIEDIKNDIDENIKKRRGV